MAFSFDTFVKDQKQSAVDVVDTITPSQVKQVTQAYRDGLNMSPKQAINETLEQFTGVNLSGGAGLAGLGAQAKGLLEGQAADLVMQLEQQVLGCINTAIRDLMNKVPEIDFILNFEDRINGILGNFRNKLEQKIDAELRKLAFNKLKFHQTTLFKQRIRLKIKDLCPGATPASVPEVQEFNRNLRRLFNRRTAETIVADTGPAISVADLSPSSSTEDDIRRQAPSPPVSISPGKVKELKQPEKQQQEVQKRVGDILPEVRKEKEKQKQQVESNKDAPIPRLVPQEPAPREDAPEVEAYRVQTGAVVLITPHSIKPDAKPKIGEQVFVDLDHGKLQPLFLNTRPNDSFQLEYNPRIRQSIKNGISTKDEVETDYYNIVDSAEENDYIVDLVLTTSGEEYDPSAQFPETKYNLNVQWKLTFGIKRQGKWEEETVYTYVDSMRVGSSIHYRDAVSGALPKIQDLINRKLDQWLKEKNKE